jgi:hypothetical protein
MKTYVHFVPYLAQFFLEWEMFQTKVVEKIETYILCSVTSSFLKIHTFYEIMWVNIYTAGQARNNNTVHAHCMQDT